MKKSEQASHIDLSPTKFTSDVALFFITELILKVRGFIFLPIIAKTLGSTEYGIWT